MTATRQLAERFSGLSYTDVPTPAIAEMKRLLVDYLGVALAGSRTASGRIAADFAIELGGEPQASVLGRTARVPAVHAAFANAVAEHSIELDDVDDLALFHYGPPVMSAALAVAQWRGASGQRLLTAAAAGCEVMNRVSLATNPSLRDRGFHTTPTCGVFGATVAACLLLDLSAEETVSALGLAGAQASGLMEMYGTSMQKRVNPGPTARNGVTAAVLAGKGFTGADTIIDGERGFGAAFSDDFDLEPLLADLATRFTFAVEYKPYSSARPIHNAIDCALEIRARRRLDLDDIVTVTVYRHPDWARYHTIARPRSYHEAQVSLPYSVAIAFAEGRALPDQYANERLSEPSVTALAERLVIKEDPTLPRGVSCRMVVTTRDGAELTSQVDHPRGSLANPLSDDDLVEKLLMLSQPTLSHDRARELAAAVFAVDTLDDVNRLVELARPNGGE